MSSRHKPSAQHVLWSTRHMPRATLAALHLLTTKMDPPKQLWQVVNLALRLGARAIGEAQGLDPDDVLPPPKAKNGSAKVDVSVLRR